MSDIPFPGLSAALPARHRSWPGGAGIGRRLSQAEASAATDPTRAAPAVQAAAISDVPGFDRIAETAPGPSTRSQIAQ